MPQMFQVLRCFQCCVFQVHQTKKSNKWQCKLCGEKQSIKRHYGLGTGKECRLHVQRLNGIRADLDDLNDTHLSNKNSDDEDFACNKINNSGKDKSSSNKESKWLEYVDATENVPEPETTDMYIGTTEVVLEVPKKRRKFTNPKLKNVLLTPITTNSSNDIYEANHSFEKSERLPNYLFKKSNKEEFHTSPITQMSKTLSKNTMNTTITEQNKPHNKIMKEKVESFVVSKIDKNSKWAIYADECEKESDDTLIKTFNKNISQGNTTHNLFSQCYDSELDDMLDI